MAKNQAVWGIDIGRCALKALRCHIEGEEVVADGFDYIEYPKLLTQPEADGPQMVKEAIEQFLSRNTLRGDKVAISVAGDAGLARYFKPPPVDVKKIADIVKYEARQQIPFDLNDVIWDYQRMAGGQEVEGFAMDTEVGLFAMKREQVSKALQPFLAAAIEVDIIQLAPIAIYNFAAFDFIPGLPEGEEYNSEDPPTSTVILSIGTDTSDLVITNGYRVWQRNIPLGGSHFTKQLSKDMKLTFAKAEHLKRNPKQADDPKAIFQAMRQVFADLVTEVQRSIGFFQSLDRKAKIGNVVLLGNTTKLPGLQQYLSKHLSADVREITSFSHLSGSGVVASPAFKDNVPAFGNCYGLCLQGLGRGRLSTNLLPREFLTERMIRAKKPWAVGAVAAIVLALPINYLFQYNVWNQVHPSRKVQDVSWEDAKREAGSVKTRSDGYVSTDTAQLQKLGDLKKIATEVVGTADRRVLWAELLRAVNQQMPVTPGLENGQIPDLATFPMEARRELHIEYIESEYFTDLDTWWKMPGVKKAYAEGLTQEERDELNKAPAGGAAKPGAAGGAAAAPGGAPGGLGGAAPSGPPGGAGGPGYGLGGGTGMPGLGGGMPGMAGGNAPTAAVDIDINVPGPKGAGWVIEVKGHHFFNSSDPKLQRLIGAAHVKAEFLQKLKYGQVTLPPTSPGQPPMTFFLKEVGISYPIMLPSGNPNFNNKIPNPNYVPPKPAARPGTGAPMGETPAAAEPEVDASAPAADDPNNVREIPAPRFDFTIQFVWQEKPMKERLLERIKAQEEAAKAAAAAPQAGAAQPGVAQPGVAQPVRPVAPAPAAAGVPAAAAPPVPGAAAPAGATAPVPGPAVPAGAATPAAAAPVPAGAAPAPVAPAGAAAPAAAAPVPAATAAPMPADTTKGN